MGQMGPSAIVPPPMPKAAYGGLLQSVEPSPDSDVLVGNWELGISFVSDSTAITGDDLVSPCEAVASREDPDNPEQVDYQPWEVSVSIACQAAGYDKKAAKARLERAFRKVASRNLEAELWHGTRAAAESWPNNWLANVAGPNYVDLTPAGGARPLVYAHADLAQAILDASNEAGVIHASARLVDLWRSADIVMVDDGVICDIFGNTIICGPGYDGADPDGLVDSSHATEWAYATGPIVTRISEVEMHLDSATAVRTTNNRFLVHGQAFVAAYWDNVVHFGIEVDLCDVVCTPPAD